MPTVEERLAEATGRVRQPRRQPRSISVEDLAAEASKPKPRAESKKSPPAAKMTAENVEKLVVHGFAGVAIFRRRAYWAADPAEVKPWSKEAAELLNKIPSRWLAAASNASSATAVLYGLGMMFAARVQMDARFDAEIAAQTAQAADHYARAQPPAHRTQAPVQPQAPAQSSTANGAAPPAGTHSGGAAPVTPPPIEGIGGAREGIG